VQDASYAHEKDGSLLLGNNLIEAAVETDPQPRLAALLNKSTGTTFTLKQSQDCLLRLASSQLRIDIPEWRFHPGSLEAVPPEKDAGYRAGFHLPDFDTSMWTGPVQQLNRFPIGESTYVEHLYPGYGWFRSAFVLPPDARGKPIEFGLGGCDNYDWLEYWIYVNGTLIGHAAPEGRWHAAPRYVVKPADDAYTALRFGASNTLAVQTRGIDRRTPDMPASDAERMNPRSFLADQYVSVGPAWREVSTFHLINHRETSDSDRAAIEFTLANEDEHLRLTVRFWVVPDEAAIYKRIDVHNVGDSPQTLLELEMQHLACDTAVSAGGMGLPCTIGDELFCSIMHPAGICQGSVDEVCLKLHPGRTLAPGASYESKVAVIGAGPAGQAGQTFVRHVEEHSLRTKEPIHIVDTYGAHDMASPENPTDVTEEIVLASLDNLEALQKRGVCFDYYFIDTGWSNLHGDLRDFDPRNFPDGPERLVKRIHDLGMKFGLWFSPTGGPMAFRPEIENRALADCGLLPSAHDADAEPAPGIRGGLCLATEPYRTMFRDALLFHVRENDVVAVKLDCFSYVCTNPAHEHLPGKYSVETQIDTLIDILNEVRSECPQLFCMFYGTFRSPWWLLHGATVYDRGFMMEGATPSATPAMQIRQSVTYSFDQAAHLSWDLLPPASQDSLGIWITNTRWGTYMGRQGWQDAWIMEIARGSLLGQLWGDLALFDDDDVDFLARTSAWVRANSRLLLSPRRILGSPWKDEPYGYAHFDGDRGAVFINNPTLDDQTVTLRLADEIGFSADRTDSSYSVHSLHPKGDTFYMAPLRAGDSFDVPLRPLEVKMLEVSPTSTDSASSSPSLSQPPKSESIPLPCEFKELSCEKVDWADADSKQILQRLVNGRTQWTDTEATFLKAELVCDARDRDVVHRTLAATLNLPPASAPASLILTARLSRDGVYWHHRAVHDLVRAKAAIDGAELPVTSTPNQWHMQGGGWSWILFRFQLPETRDHAAAAVSLQIEQYLPRTVTADLKTWLLHIP